MQSSVVAKEPAVNFDLKDLSSGLCAEIIKKIDLIYHILLYAGYPTRSYTAKSAQILLGLSEERKKDILLNLEQWFAILSSVDSTLDYVDESKLADKALTYFNFRLKNDDWLSRHQNEIIEIYSPRGLQLYRSMNFFKTCGYSLLDLCVNEWFVLWERPKSVIDKLHSVVADVLAGVKQDTAVGVGPHLIRETYNDGTTQPFFPRSAIVEFKNIYPAYGFNKTDIIGFVVTSSGRVIQEGEEALKVSFI